MPGCALLLASACTAPRLPSDPDPTAPSRSTRGSSGDSPQTVATAPSLLHPVPDSASAASLSPIRASVLRSVPVGLANSVDRGTHVDSQCEQFSIAKKWEIYSCQQQRYYRRGKVTIQRF